MLNKTTVQSKFKSISPNERTYHIKDQLSSDYDAMLAERLDTSFTKQQSTANDWSLPPTKTATHKQLLREGQSPRQQLKRSDLAQKLNRKRSQWLATAHQAPQTYK
jgi:hypothetical protein